MAQEEQPVRITIVLSPQPEGGFTVTSPLLPELVTEGDTVGEALANVPDAVRAVVELYEDMGRALPAGLYPTVSGEPITLDTLIMA